MIFSVARFAHAQDTPPVPCVATPPPEGYVIVTGASDVVVTGSGWKRGDDVEFVRTRAGAAEGEPPKVERIATGRVVSVMPGRARVSVGIDTRVPAGASAQRMEQAHSDYPLAPGRLPNVVHAGFDVRTFLPLDVSAGIGMLASAFGMYRFDAPVAVRLNVVSVGFVTSAPGGAVFDGNVALSFDTQYFELGLGAGALTTYLYWDSVPISFEVAHFLRVGAIDGLKLETQVAEYLDSATFSLADVHGLIQVPITRRWWLVTRGGRGSAEGQPLYAYGELGARLLLTGNGDRHSLFLTVAFGGTAVGAHADSPYTRSSVVGPSFSGGLDWRL
jgi:hypothetical protein